MRAVTLGTASAYPTPSRGVSCTAVMIEDGDVWLFDCGEGSQIQIQRSSVKSSRVTKIFITHLHGDHVFGLPGLLCTIGIQWSNRSSEGVHIYGPQGLRKFLRTALSLSYSNLPFTYTVEYIASMMLLLQVHEMIPIPDEMVTEKTEWNISRVAEGPLHPQEIIGQDIPANQNIWSIYEDEKMIVQAGPVEHTVPCVGYVLRKKDSVGKLDTKRLMDLGIPPGPLYGRIKAGESIQLPDGSILSPEDVIGPSKKGWKVTILGDTSNPYQIGEIARESDILFHEATFLKDMKEKALEYGHSTPSMAAQFALDIRARKLVLFHYSHRYNDHSDKTKDKQADVTDLLQEAEETLSEKNISNIIVELAKDLMEFCIP